MKKLILFFALFASFAVNAYAQNLSTVTAGNIQDINGTKLAAGQLCFLITDQQDNPISVQIGGGGQALKRGYCSPVSAGVATSFTVPEPAHTSPAGIYYRVTVKDSSTGQEVLRYTQVTFTGATFNFDNYAPLNLGNFASLTGNSVSGNLSVSGNVAATGTVTGSNIPANILQQIFSSGVGQTQRTAFNVMAGITCSDNAGTSRTDCRLGTLTTVSFSATPTFDASTASSFKLTLTGNVTSSTLSNAVAGEPINIEICQDATGGRTFVPPTNVLNMGTIVSTANTCSTQEFWFDGSNAVSSGPMQSAGSTIIPGNATVGGTLGVTGATTLSSTLGVTGNTTLSGTLGVTGAAILSSTLAVTGTSTLASLNKTIYADQQAGADACAKITASFALLPATGGIVDATGFQGNQVCASGVTFPASKPITLKVGAAALITGTNVTFTIPASGLVTIKGLGPTSGGSGTTSVISSTAPAAISWAGSEGGIEDLEIFNSAGDGLSLVASGTNSVSHNHFKHLHIGSTGTLVSGKAGLHLTANSATALVTENIFENIIIDDFDISELLDTSAAQGPTDNYHMGFTYSGFAGAGTAGIKITSGDVNTWTHGFISERTTGVRITAGNYNMFLGNRFETGGTDANDAGTGTMFVGNSFSNCATSTFAVTATLLGSTGNITCTFDLLPRGISTTIVQGTDFRGITPKFQKFTGNGTFTIPTGVTAVKVTIIAGGGAGGGSSTTTWGSGGGSGGTGIRWLSSLTPGNTITVTVGAGGTGVANAIGNTGGDSSISSGTQTITTITAKAGVGGNVAGGQQPGGNGGTIGTNGDINVGGQQGGVSPGNGFGGVGAPSTMGGGGAAGVNSAGSAGLAPGAGGGGAGEVGAGTAAGGAGLAGMVIFEWLN